MYQLKCTIKCPEQMKSQIVDRLTQLKIDEIQIEKIDYEKFVSESRMYWDYVFPEMKLDGKPVIYLSFAFEDTKEGRELCHDAELKLGWIPLNIRYVEVQR